MMFLKPTFIYLTFVLFFGVSCTSQNRVELENVTDNEIGSDLLVGATLNYHELGTQKEVLFSKHFTYLTPANAAKQSAVLSTPDNWKWTKIDTFLALAKANNLQVRIHGPISPQASKWAKDDTRTPQELLENMIQFMTASAKKYNEIPEVKWMDVVNETILKDGSWFGPKAGVDKWENPWLHIGLDDAGFPIYILKAFELATEHAPNVKLVYNQNSGMEEVMWDKVKETILYIRSKGYRVDGIGWQAHLLLGAKREDFVDNTAATMKKLADLIDWAHANDLAFHVTELDYLIKEGEDKTAERLIQKRVYQALVTVLLEKSKNGEVTLNLWDLGERYKSGTGHFQSIYDENFEPTPAYDVIMPLVSKEREKDVK
ncbi:endo-1,4-beta-xylanase [Flavicella marina]|uniref:endo-1,4-beta-xylanase n=1 Tax=Flavicella marina TaxID=1475951 RepID=UPI001264C094|nr:endo-1,4-beta-xylanase [Flavicella marina]